MYCCILCFLLFLFSSYAVTFSRIDPGGKLVMGFRKASNSVDMQVKPHSHILKFASSLVLDYIPFNFGLLEN